MPIQGETDEGAAALLMTELVTNAILHSTSESVMVEIELTEAKLSVGVSDDEPSPPITCARGSNATGGRGMALVACLSQEWGVSPRPGGKRVWFDLNREAHE